jgi:choline dehydrogenase-like flavoprotein
VSFKEAANDLALEVDYVVVGSGAGGATAAVTLARSGARVAIVEAGAWRDPEHYPSSTYGAMRDLFDDWGATVARGRVLWPIVQARTVGGTTVINCAICVRTPGDVLADWRTRLGIGDERFERRIGEAQDELERELCAEVVPAEATGRSNALALIGANALGYASHALTRYAKGCVGSGQCLQGCRALRKQSTNVNFVPEVLALGGDVLSCAPVSRVVFEGRRAVAVTGEFVEPRTRRRGSRFTVRARKAVVVAASVTQTAPLLEASGVRSPMLGEGFRAHPGAGTFGVFDEIVDHNIGATQGWASTAFRDTPGVKLESLSIPPEMIASRLPGAGTVLMERLREYRHIAMWVGAVRAQSVGTVHRGWFGKPSVRYGLDRADMERLRAAFVLTARTQFAAGARKVLPGVFGLPYAITPDELPILENAPLDPRRYIAVVTHLFGGCVMGRDPREGVTDVHGRVHGYEALVIADASVIPTVLGVNPQHTIMALARIFAEDLLAA